MLRLQKKEVTYLRMFKMLLDFFQFFGCPNLPYTLYVYDVLFIPGLMTPMNPSESVSTEPKNKLKL